MQFKNISLLAFAFCFQFAVIDAAEKQESKKQKCFGDPVVSDEVNFNEDYPILAQGFQLAGQDFQIFMQDKLLGLHPDEFITCASGERKPRFADAIDQAEELLALSMSHRLKDSFKSAIKEKRDLDEHGCAMWDYAHNHKDLFGKDILKKLVEVESSGIVIDANTTSYTSESTASYLLGSATDNNNIQITERLLAIGANPSGRCCLGMSTLLYNAMYYSRNEIATMLIKAGADVNVPGEGQKTPLYRAVRENNFELMAMLIAAGARDIDENYNIKYIVSPNDIRLCDPNPEMKALIAAEIAKRNAAVAAVSSNVALSDSNEDDDSI